uniref:Uncharacterized protein n=1 Tax=Chromera velia CCMP2878 TaxID=1169474 RepID=A0A0G4FBM9_9ALVE|eukprot:Cvel_16177.t1-p1 / transcript=Cvel_16177.t1 / gene=Cvel_16177 / organism=Chromera_velia_CCMP2878 / gene_product=hypothetical protein / transcript_product=hypothetical protein / location=Cvel_scaffold1234:4475-8686(-) / protein_length=612 / sequence_SO=supercontig / SO=protein_coding / is_pseudo=false
MHTPLFSALNEGGRFDCAEALLEMGPPLDFCDWPVGEFGWVESVSGYNYCPVDWSKYRRPFPGKSPLMALVLQLKIPTKYADGEGQMEEGLSLLKKLTEASRACDCLGMTATVPWQVFSQKRVGKGVFEVTALSLACGLLLPSVVEILLAAGAPFSPSCISMATLFGQRRLNLHDELEWQQNLVGVIQKIVHSEKGRGRRAEALLSAQYDIQPRGCETDTCTLLFFACERRYEHLLKFLLDSGVSPEVDALRFTAGGGNGGQARSPLIVVAEAAADENCHFFGEVVQVLKNAGCTLDSSGYSKSEMALRWPLLFKYLEELPHDSEGSGSNSDQISLDVSPGESPMYSSTSPVFPEVPPDGPPEAGDEPNIATLPPDFRSSPSKTHPIGEGNATMEGGEVTAGEGEGGSHSDEGQMPSREAFASLMQSESTASSHTTPMETTVQAPPSGRGITRRVFTKLSSSGKCALLNANGVNGLLCPKCSYRNPREAVGTSQCLLKFTDSRNRDSAQFFAAERGGPFPTTLQLLSCAGGQGHMPCNYVGVALPAYTPPADAQTEPQVLPERNKKEARADTVLVLSHDAPLRKEFTRQMSHEDSGWIWPLTKTALAQWMSP